MLIKQETTGNTLTEKAIKKKVWQIGVKEIDYQTWRCLLCGFKAGNRFRTGRDPSGTDYSE